MNYFVTGGTGFIGNRLVHQLREAGHDVTALVRTPERAQELVALGASLAEGDITDKESMRAAMTGADGVFHVAAWYKIGTKDRARAEAINVGGTRNVLELMRELEIPKGVYTSTLAVFSDTHGTQPDESYRFEGPHLSEYDRTKWVAHYEVALPMMQDGLPLVVVQPGVVYGPGDTSAIGDLFRQYLKRKLFVLPKESAYCWAHVDDVARAHVLAMEKGRSGEAYIISGPCHTLEHAFDLAEQITGIRAPSFRIGAGPMKGLARLMSRIGSVVPLPPMYTGESLRVSAGVTYMGDNAKAQRELGYAPRPLAEGLRETLEAMRSAMPAPKSA